MGVLYHGTSAARWASIQRDGIIRKAPFGDQGVSLTDLPSVASYFARLAADCDGCEPVILSVDPDELAALGLPLEHFTSNVWGPGECDWERETMCWAYIPASLARLTTPSQEMEDHAELSQRRVRR